MELGEQGDDRSYGSNESKHAVRHPQPKSFPREVVGRLHRALVVPTAQLVDVKILEASGGANRRAKRYRIPEQMVRVQCRDGVLAPASRVCEEFGGALASDASADRFGPNPARSRKCRRAIAERVRGDGSITAHHRAVGLGTTVTSHGI